MRRILLAVVLLPALLVWPVLRGTAAWVHSHGLPGGHVHLLPADLDHDHDVGALHDWHETQHRHEDGSGTHAGDEPLPEGVLIELPELVAVSPQGSMATPPAQSQAPALFQLSLSPCASSFRPEVVRSGWPPTGRGRSGVAALLRSSHAIRI